ncbi:MAG TPA: hypothetical protein VJ992_09135 [Gemmatimonadales bacterium]|nr:hypothetical protein [Gemmatimonadales bacterium]
MSTAMWPWVAILALGIWHGVNPAMGWLFAVGLGMQEQNRRAAWRALLPLALGHGLAIVVAIGGAALIGLVVPLTALRWGVAGVLLALALYRMVRHGHPRFGGMRVGSRDLVIWSFLMATAHGAGLMVVPFVLGGTLGHGHHVAGGHGMHLASLVPSLSDERMLGLLAAGVHTLGYLVVTGAIAALVYEKLGLRLLRTAWINLDLIWVGALFLTAVVTPFI